MEDTGITFETAKLAKEKGFDIPTIQYYTIKGYCTESEGYMTERYAESNWNNGMGSYPTRTEEVSCSAPTQSLLSKWLREKHNIIVLVDYEGIDGYYYKYYYYINEVKKYNASDKNYITFEEAYEIGLQEALKLIK